MLKKLAIIFLILLVILLSGMLYLNKVFFPIQLKSIINQKSQEFLQRRLTYKEIVFLPFKGIVIKDLIIYQKEDASAPFFRAEEISASVIIPSLLKNFQIIIPSVTIRKPFLHLARGVDGKWNYQDLLKAPAPGQTPGPNPVAIGGIVIEDGRAQISDRMTKPLAMEIWENVNIKAQLAMNKSVRFDVNMQNISQKISVKAAGAYAFTTKDGNIQAVIQNLNFAKYFNLFYTGTDIVISEGHIESAKIILNRRRDNTEIHADLLATAYIIQTGDRHFRGRVNIQNLDFIQAGEDFTCRGKISGQNLLVKLNKDQIFQGSIETKNINFSKQKKDIESGGELDLSDFGARWAPGQSINGNFSLREFALTQKNDDLLLTAKLSSPKMSASVDGNTLTGELKSLDTVVARKNTALSGQGSLALNKLTVSLARGEQITGDLSVSGLSLKGRRENLSVSGQARITSPAFTAANLSGEAKDIILPFEITLVQNDQQTTLIINPVINELTLRPDKKNTVTAASITGKNFVAIFSPGKMQLRGQAATDNLTAQLAGGQSFAGAPEISFSAQDNPQDKIPLQYQAQVTLTNAKFLGAPVVGEVKDITGAVTITENAASFDRITFNTLGTAAEVKGAIKNFAAPEADIKLSAQNVDLTKANLFLNEQMEKFAIKAAGAADLDIAFTGPLQDPQNAAINGSAFLRNTKIEAKSIPGGPVENITGRINYDADRVSWENLKATWQKNIFTLNGDLKGFAKPAINLNIDSDIVLLDAKADIDGNVITLNTCSGRFYDSAFDVSGRILLKANADPFLDISGHVNLNLNDLSQFDFSGGKPKKLPLSGDLIADFKFKGQPKNYPKAVIALNAASSEISVNTYKFNDLKIDLTHGQSEFGKFKLTGNFYKGVLAIDGVTDTREQPSSFHLTGKLDGTDLAAIKADNKFNGQDISGTLSASTELDGPMNDINLIHGKFAFQVTNGMLMEMNFLKGLWRVLLVPEMSDVKFTDASGNFFVQDGKLASNDIFVKGSLADLLATGWVDFKGNVNFDVTPKFKELGILQSESMRKGPTAILTQGGILSVNIKGTVQHPSYMVNTSPAKILKNATGTIIEGVQDILDGILNK